MRNSPASRIGAATLCGWLAILCGCQKSPPVCRISGKVLVRNLPAEEFCLRFHALAEPQGLTSPHTAVTEADGTFAVIVKSPGEYGLSALWPKITVVEGERLVGDDQLGGRYNHPEAPFMKTMVVAGDNTLPDIVIP